MMNGLCSLSIENHKVTDHLSAFLSYLIERDPLTGYILLLLTRHFRLARFILYDVSYNLAVSIHHAGYF